MQLGHQSFTAMQLQHRETAGQLTIPCNPVHVHHLHSKLLRRVERTKQQAVIFQEPMQAFPAHAFRCAVCHVHVLMHCAAKLPKKAAARFDNMVVDPC